MKKNEKKLIVILILVSVLIIGVIYFITRSNKEENIKTEMQNDIQSNVENEIKEYVQELDDGTKINTSTKLNEIKKVEGLEFSNISLTKREGQTILLANVKNTTDTATDVKLVNIILLDKEGKEISRLLGAVTPLKPYEEKQFQTNATLDYTNVYDFKIEIKK